jgi:hypothetical protein
VLDKAKATDARKLAGQIARGHVGAKLFAPELGVGRYRAARAFEAIDRLVQPTHHLGLYALHTLVKTGLAGRDQIVVLPPNAASGQQQAQNLGGACQHQRHLGLAVTQAQTWGLVGGGVHRHREAPVHRRPGQRQQHAHIQQSFGQGTQAWRHDGQDQHHADLGQRHDEQGFLQQSLRIEWCVHVGMFVVPQLPRPPSPL